jgi:signal transduction histidine kinase
VRDALEELSRLGGIVERLLLLSTADSGRLMKRWDPVDLAEVADRVVQVASVAAGGKGIRVALELRSSPVVLGDRLLLLQAVHNVVENAVKYGRPGGKVDVIVDGQGLEVSDDGPGIAPEHLPRIFDRLYRGDPARSDQVPGVGLGLSIARAIAEAHGGRITAASEPGSTRFRFDLPAESSREPVRT